MEHLSPTDWTRSPSRFGSLQKPMLISPEPAARSAYRLSKSRYLSGLQCHKRLYLEVHVRGWRPNRMPPPRRFSIWGRIWVNSPVSVFPAGVPSRRLPTISEALAQTAELLQDSTVRPSLKAPFSSTRCWSRVDVLQRVGVNELGQPTWRLVEVKSSTKVKATHVDDLTIQGYVLGTWTGAGGYLSDACEYAVHVFDGQHLDLDQPTGLRSLAETVRPTVPEIRARLAAMRTMLEAMSAQACLPDEHCQSPYRCPFWNHCTEHKPARWIYHFAGK